MADFDWFGLEGAICLGTIGAEEDNLSLTVVAPRPWEQGKHA